MHSRDPMSSLAQDASATGSMASAPTQSAPPQSAPPPPTQEQMMAIFAIRAGNDHDALRLYAAVLSGFMGLFIISHLLKLLGRNNGFGRSLAAISRPFRFLTTSLEKLILVKVPGAPSLGHAAVFLGYLALNVGFIFVYVDDSILSLHVIVAARTGWLAVGNLCLTVFLSLKNTPLGFLAGWSYERLNSFHRVSGMMTFLLVVVHAASYSSFFLDQQNAARLRFREEIFGIVAGFTLLVVVSAALTLQRRRYELFYVLHVIFFIVSLVFISLHHPTAAERVIIAIGLAAGMWGFDRLVRASRLVYHSINNTATLQPLANGGTRVTLNKGLVGGKSGQHAFLWIPGIRLLETHPFTIASMKPMEFVVDSHDGFTRDLHEYAMANPGAVLKASVEGPYGQVPEPADYDKVLIFAGGSGATFGFGTALQLLRDFEASVPKDVTLVWTMRDPALLEWFSAHLNTLTHAPGFRVLVYITGQTELKKLESNDRTTDRSDGALMSEDSLETASARGQSGFTHGAPVNYGRPNVDDTVAQAVDGMATNSRVLVMGCGPNGLLQEVRKSTTSRMVADGPRVSLYFEQFGW